MNDVPFIDKVFIGDQSNQSFLQATFNEIGMPDVILDDGSHESFDIVETFLTTFPKLADGGTYLIEDTCCAYYSTHRKLFHGLTMMDFFKGLSDKLSLDLGMQQHIDTRFRQPMTHRQGKLEQKRGIVKDIHCIAFFDSIIVIEKAIDQAEPLRHVI